MEYHSIFSLEPGELGWNDLAKHEIKVVDDEPIKERFWRIPPPMVHEVHTNVKDMLEAGTIHLSQSLWCNAVVLVCKKDRGLQFCIDFCKLNSRTKKDSYPLPQIQEDMKSLAGAGYFYFDLKDGFWQITKDEGLKLYTAFTVGNLRFFECKHKLFRLCNVPTMFQRLMQNFLGKLNMTYCLIYLDDVIVFLKTEVEHVHHLYIVFKCFREHHLKFKPTKCAFFKSEINYLAHHAFFKSEINYLAHHASKDSVQPSKENLKAVSQFAPPWSYTEIQSFLGLVGHYRWFIKGFACSAQPLHNHLSGEGASKKNKWVMLTENTFGCLWGSQEILPLGHCAGFCHFNRPFFFETDGSKQGLGAVPS